MDEIGEQSRAVERRTEQTKEEKSRLDERESEASRGEAEAYLRAAEWCG